MTCAKVLPITSRGFVAIGGSGTLIGPWNPWIHSLKFGGPVWELVKALSSTSRLPKAVREVAILVTGAHFHAAYELYAHVLVAELQGLSDDTIGTIVTGQRPADLQHDKAVAYDVASSWVNESTLPEMTYRKAVENAWTGLTAAAVMFLAEITNKFIGNFFISLTIDAG